MSAKKRTASESKVKEVFGKDIEEMSNEELQGAVLRVQLMREMQLLEKTQEEVRRHDENTEAIHLRNEQRQSELNAIRKKQENIQRQCRHKQGGKHQNVLKGDGPPAVTAARMLDGYTVRLQCQRCRKTVFTPNPKLEADDPKRYAKELAEYEKFLEMFEDSGMDMIRGPEFMFMREGVPFIPERV